MRYITAILHRSHIIPRLPGPVYVPAGTCYSLPFMGIGLILFALAAVTGCCSESWVKFPVMQGPDLSYRTGADGGYDVYIWNCMNNRRVVIYKFTASFTCREPEKQTSQCGEITPIEAELKDTSKRRVPDSLLWPAPFKSNRDTL